MAAVPVLFLLPALPVGGAERQIASLARGLDPARFHPLVACQHALGPVADDLRAAGIDVTLLSDSRRFDARFVRRLTRFVHSRGVKVILSHGFSTGVAARIAGLLGGAPVRILAEHSTGERDMSPARHRLNRLLAPWTSAWVSVAHGQRDYLVGAKGIPEARIHVIPNGIDPAPFRAADGRTRVRVELGIPEDARVAGILAALRPEKAHRTFLLAARFVADELPDAHFLLAGDGPERNDLAREIHALNLVGRAHLAGRRADVADVLSAFDVSVLCSTDVETFPMAFLESMATGLPLVGTEVGGLGEMIRPEENGILVRPRDPRGLADAMLRLLSDRDLAARFGEASRRLVEAEFTLTGMVGAYEELFTRLLAARGIRPGAS